MNFKKIKKQIFDGVADAVMSEGFLYNKENETFEKNIPGGFVYFYFLYADYKNEFWFDLWWGVTIDQVADIYNRVTEKDLEFQRLTLVLSNHLGALADYADNGNESTRADRKQYIVSKDEDAATVVGQALEDIRRYLLPYFAQNTTIERLDQIINHKPADITVHNFSYPTKAKMGLIAAKLNHNPDYNQLISIYDKELIRAEAGSKREYEKLKELLSKM